MAEVYESLTVKFGANTVEFDKSIKGINQANRALKSEFIELNKQLKFDPKNTELLTQKQKNLEQQLKLNTDKLEQLKNKQKELGDTKVGGQEWLKLQQQIDKTNTSIAFADNEIKKVDTELKNIDGSEFKNLETGATGAANKLNNIDFAVLGAASQQLKPVGDAIIGFGTSAVKTAANFEALESQMEQTFGGELGKAKATINELADSLGVLPERIAPNITKATSQFRGLGLSTSEAMKTAKQSTTIAADAAAFFDVSLESATSSLNSFVKGNYEGGESIGIFAKETTMANFAVEQGLITESKEWANLSEAIKQTTRLSFAEKMQKDSGAMGQAARESQSLENNLGNLNQVWANFQAEIGKDILPIVISALDAAKSIIQGLVGVWNKLNPVGQTFILVLGGIIAAITTLAPIITAIMAIISTLGATALLPIIGIIAGIAAAITAIILIIKNWGNIWNWLKTTTISVFNLIKTTIQTQINNIKNIINATLNTIKSVWGNIFNSIKALTVNIVNGIVGAFSGITGKITGFFSGLPQAVWGVISSIGGFGLSIANGIVGAFSGITGKITGFFSGLPQAVWGVISSIGGFGADLVNTIVGAFNNIRDLITNKIKDALGGAWSAITSFFGGGKGGKGGKAYNTNIATSGVLGGAAAALMNVKNYNQQAPALAQAGVNTSTNNNIDITINGAGQTGAELARTIEQAIVRRLNL